jgi:hypothetical protein
MHAPVLEFSSRLVYHLLPGLLAYQIIFQPLLVVLGMGLPVVVMNIVNKTPARVFYKYLFG